MKQHDSDKSLDIVLHDKLLAEAASAAEQAYAPYSGFRVGAAVLCGRGAIYRGANIENASLGLCTCAERVALASAYAAGERDIIAIAVACVDAPQDAPLEQRMPCGACRQWIRELAPHAAIIIPGAERSFSIRELMPLAFSLDSGLPGRRDGHG
ncbi:cytidine deaminase [Desulfomicrobium norvegicum]|uniref:Cytidine deaminase n=1 Tax=Desulfomicrobium norvegicum (strain DSM 1741 / NCIMB 8310) TaxID=52561 RepID=A0A8G2FG08_DESNO|nr:cytidine deaminase [Desulfomicrobium norvegicum]SFM19002.1 cytidine deaminase [Desulfomicrobium norvegicum]